MVNIIWIQLAQFMGKGLTTWEIIKLLYYMGASVVSLVLPLTILLSSIMTFGDFGERYELAAMKAAGISLTRIMTPLFIVSIGLAGILFLFQNNITPDFQRKAKNMMYNIAATKPALNFTPGQFIHQLPGYAIKFDKIEGENGELVEGVFIHKSTNIYEDQQAIVAKRGKFAPAADKNYLKLLLYDGYVYEDNYKNKDYFQRLKQPNQAVKFDTLVSHFDISELINSALEKEAITDDYRFQTYNQIDKTIVEKKKENDEIISSLGMSIVSNANNYLYVIENNKKPKTKVQPQFKFDTVKTEKKLEILYAAYNKLESQKLELSSKTDQVNGIVKYQNKMIMYQQRIFSSSFTCVIFFLIGASLGSIIRKGGVGLPVVIAIVIFIIFYVMNLSVENLAWKGRINAYLAAWIPNFVLFPFSMWLTYKALTDSQIFDPEKYMRFIRPIMAKIKGKKAEVEHQRYQ